MPSVINKKVANPIPSDDIQIGGEWANAIIDLLHGVFLTDENLSIGTPIKWKAGSLLVYDGNSHSIAIETEDMATGAVVKHAIFRQMTEDTQYIVTESQQQTSELLIPCTTSSTGVPMFLARERSRPPSTTQSPRSPD